METIREACQLQPNALSIKLSDQIEQLDKLRTQGVFKRVGPEKGGRWEIIRANQEKT